MKKESLTIEGSIKMPKMPKIKENKSKKTDSKGKTTKKK